MIISLIVGVISGTVGNGEGIIFVAIFIEIGIHPQIACATGMYISIFYSASTAGVYMIEGFFDDMYMLFFIPITMFAAFLGILINSLLVKKLGRNSITILFLSGTFLIAAITITHQASHRVFRSDSHGRATEWDTGKYCMNNEVK